MLSNVIDLCALFFVRGNPILFYFYDNNYAKLIHGYRLLISFFEVTVV